MSAVDLEALAALDRGAFRAPWTYDDFEIDCPQIDAGGDDCGYTHNRTRIESPDEYPDGQVVADIDVPGLEGFARANGELIVAMRNQLGAILAELRASRAVVAGVRSAHRMLNSTSQPIVVPPKDYITLLDIALTEAFDALCAYDEIGSGK